MPSSGNPISFLQLQNEFGGTNPISLDEYYSGGTFINSTITDIVSSGAIGIDSFYGKRKITQGFLSLDPRSTTFTLPSYVANRVQIILIGGGGGGGGGSNRAAFAGYFTGGGGGGAGGYLRILNAPVTPGETISYSIGAGGAAGGLRDGIYSSGSRGGQGGQTSIKLASMTQTYYASGGGGGVQSPGPAGGAAGAYGPGNFNISISYNTSDYLGIPGPLPGGNAVTNRQTGGGGAAGFVFNGNNLGKTPHVYDKLIEQARGALTKGSAGVTYTTNTYGDPATGVGAGGNGGGTVQGDQGGQPLLRRNSYPGIQGGIYIWWGFPS